MNYLFYEMLMVCGMNRSMAYKPVYGTQDIPDPRRLRYIASHFSQLRGFRQVACGVFLLLVFGAMELDNNWTFGLLALLFIALGLSFWRLGKYYEQRFGRVEARIAGWASWSLRVGIVRCCLSTIRWRSEGTESRPYKLEEAGLIRIRKEIVDKKTRTTASLLARGEREIATYWKTMDRLRVAFSP
jgi:hypothetical protein